MNAQRLIDLLLESADPTTKKSVTLEYRPYKSGEDWMWFWVLHPEDKQKAVAHGEAKSRAAASTAARLKARQLGSVIKSVTLVNPYKDQSSHDPAKTLSRDSR